MTSFLAYSYSSGFTEEEQTVINEKAKKSREEFGKGFVIGASLSLAAYFFYLLTTYAAYAAYSNVPAPGPKTPGDTCAVQPTPTSKPGPLYDTTKGGASAICAAALQSKDFDFYLGLGFAFLLVVGSIVITRRADK